MYLRLNARALIKPEIKKKKREKEKKVVTFLPSQPAMLFSADPIR